MNRIGFGTEELLSIEQCYDYILAESAKEPKLWDAGTQWYFELHKMGMMWAKRYNLTLKQVFRIIARLSISVEWEQNKKDAKNLIEMGFFAFPHMSTYDINKCFALQMLFDKDAHFFTPKRSPKTWNFYGCAMYPGKWKGVAIDRQVLAAAGIGNRITWTQYKQISGIIKRLSRKYGIMPHMAQSIIWLYSKKYLWKKNSVEVRSA